ncbi:unnamed protein product [Prorocentrum cordatum]|uniref:Uncharacterized protein n=1 Tax=Prorocentrum cordatum TaxID=2364126 RepID=A0ABN9TDW5_9DINO|nr:unnamed protein product [Polarella glacialis]
MPRALSGSFLAGDDPAPRHASAAPAVSNPPRTRTSMALRAPVALAALLLPRRLQSVAVAPPAQGVPAGAVRRPPVALGASTAARRLRSRAHRATGAAQAGSAGQAGSDAEDKGPFIAAWFGDFDQGESTFSEQGISGRYDTVGGWDVDYYNPYSGSSGKESEEFFQETPSAGSRETWQTFYPALGSTVIGNGDQATGSWRSTPEGYVQDYVPSTLVTEKAGGAGARPAEWFDSKVLQIDGLGRDQLPYPGTPERSMEASVRTYVERAVNTTFRCEGTECVAWTGLQAYNHLGEEATGCTMNVYVHPRGTITSGAKVLNTLKVNDQEVSTACFDVPSGCTSQASTDSVTSLLYPCASQINVGNLFRDGTGALIISGQISKGVSKWARGGRVLACVGFAAVSADTAVFAQGRDIVIGDEESFSQPIGDVDEEVQGYFEDFLEGEADDGRPKKRRSPTRKHRSIANLTASLDEAIPLLEADFKTKTQALRVALAYFKEKQKIMDVAKREATLAMKELRKEAEHRRLAASERRNAKQREVQALKEQKRTAKEAMIKKAQALMGAKGQDAGGMLGEMSLGIMVDVLMALPQAVENPIFLKRLYRAKDEVTQSVQDFLNITRRKSSKFVLASSKASDVELSFLMARYFHEASFRVKALQSDAQKVARDLNVVMPRELRQSFMPIIKQLRSNAVPLRVNASELAKATLPEACSQISSVMANISTVADNNKLNTMHSGLHNLWQISELMLPHMSKVYPLKSVVIDTVKDFMSMATTQVAGLQESADEIVTNIGPVVMERMQCTWSSARGRGASLVALLAPLAAVASLLAH